MRCSTRSKAFDSPPWKGCADSVLGGMGGGSFRIESGVRGLRSAAVNPSKESGMTKGACWAGIEPGSGYGGREFSGRAGRTRRG
jgi:hypothetical protein